MCLVRQPVIEMFSPAFAYDLSVRFEVPVGL